MAGPDSYPSTGSFFKEHPSSTKPPFESRKSEAREREREGERKRDCTAQSHGRDWVVSLFACVCLCVLDKTLWLIRAWKQPQDTRARERDIHRLLLTHRHKCMPAHASRRLMEVWLTIYTYLLCEIVCKILFKVATSISHAHTVFFRGYRKKPDQNMSETSPAVFFFYCFDFLHTHSLIRHL